jgi:elongation factor P hydroxylase
MTEPTAARIAQIFNAQFLGSHNTIMSGGAAEPLYEPAVGCRPARIVFTYDYPASALHEAAHWCLAGRVRRSQRDYGYWYEPGPRTAQQRREFFAAEAGVQALEAIFAQTCNVRFVVSADDFAASPEEIDAFRQRIEQCIAQRRQCLPERARRFCNALTRAFANAQANEHERG